MKFELDIAAAAFLRDEIARRLPVFEFATGYAHTFVTTIYFDTADRRFFERARRNYDHNDKIRVKDYYYEEPTESNGSSGSANSGAGTGDAGVKGPAHARCRTSPVSYVELKQRRGAIVTKKRLCVPKGKLDRFLSGEDLRDELGMAAEDSPSDGSGRLSFLARIEAYNALREYLTRFTVSATSVINYRRQVYQVDEDELRITFDDRISVYDPPADLFGPGLYGKAQALTPAVLGVPIRSFSKVITEIKCAAGEYPVWLQKALRTHSSKPLSKFTTSVSSVFREELENSLEATSSGGGQTLPKGEPKPASLDDTQVFRKPIES